MPNSKERLIRSLDTKDLRGVPEAELDDSERKYYSVVDPDYWFCPRGHKNPPEAKRCQQQHT